MNNDYSREEAAEAIIGGDLEHIGGNRYFDNDIGCEVSVPAFTKPNRRLATDAQKKKAAEARKKSGYYAFSKGTSKQKAWAETIRADIEERMPSDLKGKLSSITDAKTFIENRSDLSFFIQHARAIQKRQEDIKTQNEVSDDLFEIVKDALAKKDAKLIQAWVNGGLNMTFSVDDTTFDAFMSESFKFSCDVDIFTKDEEQEIALEIKTAIQS